MRSRNKIILLILLFWLFLVIIILLASRTLFISGFAKLEENLANESAKRVGHVFLSQLNNIYSQNLDQAYWDQSYDYMLNKDENFIKSNYNDEFYIDNKINYLIFIDNQQNVVYSRKFDLETKRTAPISDEILNYFKANALEILNHKSKYYQIQPRPFGMVGLLKIDEDIDYFAFNYIKDTNDTKPAKGVLIFGKQLTMDYFKDIGSGLNYNIKLISLNDVSEKIRSYLKVHSIYSMPLDQETYLSFLVIRDFNRQPIGILKLELPRAVYNEGKHSIFKGQFLLVIFSVLGAFGMTTLVYFFFKKQNMITLSFERFVPHELIDLLQKRDILDVNLGDSSKRALSVLFLDIRNFTTISEGLNPHDNFNFINTLLNDFAPIISNNNGFIDKYIGDAVMAIFPNEKSSADDAVKAAKGILNVLDKMNREKALPTKEPVKIGIGINTGDAMLGILGAKGRLEGTVISDMVNTASRIQTLTKTYSHEILISESCYKAMEHPEIYDIKHVDDVLVKGKTVKVAIYAVI